MKTKTNIARIGSWALFLGCSLSLMGQPAGGPPDFGGNPPFGAGGFGPGGPGGFGGMNQEEIKVVKQFDKDGNKRLNLEERKAAREYLSKQGGGRRGGFGPGGGRRGGFGPGGFGSGGENAEATKAGIRIAPAEVKTYANEPFYATNILRTVFLEFENTDWEKELEDFHGTDVEVPAKMTVDGKAYPEVGVHFRGASSYMMIGTGRKRSLNLSLDFANENQNIQGYNTLNLLNSNDDPTFMRAVLYYQLARQFGVPAPKANWVRLVVNGENWGVYVSVQQFNKQFVNEWFGTKKGARWKVPGSPNGRGGLNYIGDTHAQYKQIYEIKSKDEPKAWDDLIHLCKVLSETPADQLEKAIEPILDVDTTLKFLAMENALINNDGYWTRASDYDIYQDEKGRFHIIPYDANESFVTPGGPGFGGGPGGRGGRGGFGGPMGGGPGGFGGPGMMAPGAVIGNEMMSQGDANKDQKLSKEEMVALAESWFDKLDKDKAGKINQEQFNKGIAEILPPPPGFGPPNQPMGGDQQPGGMGRDNFAPPTMVNTALFNATDSNKDASLSRAEFKGAFEKWFAEWDAEKKGSVNQQKVIEGLGAALPLGPGAGGGFAGGPGQGQGGRGGRRGGFGGPGGFGGGQSVKGVELDPLYAVNAADKPLLSKLLAVPSYRAKYLQYTKAIAERWLDWKTLEPVLKQYQALLSDEVKADTRKLSTYDAFIQGIGIQSVSGNAQSSGRNISLKSFAEQRREYLMNYSEAKTSKAPR